MRLAMELVEDDNYRVHRSHGVQAQKKNEKGYSPLISYSTTFPAVLRSVQEVAPQAQHRLVLHRKIWLLLSVNS